MDIQSLKKEIESEGEKIKTASELASFKAGYTGKKGSVTLLFEGLKEIKDRDEKKEKGMQINALKNLVEEISALKEKELISLKRAEELKDIDVTLPPHEAAQGSLHPINLVMDSINSVFMRMGFTIEEGPDIELAEYNFTALNFPDDHPAMDMHDTFHMENGYVLRTHTSPIQIRAMLKRQPPLKIIAPGRVYRRDAVDASHSPVFHQVEGFMVATDVKFSDLKGILNVFTEEIFGAGLKTRFRPSFFPFTEPSAEVDVQCVNCRGKGCKTCKSTGWLEIMGCGMIHVNVFKAVNYDPEKYTGFAFGMGVERVAMLKYGISDMRHFFENDIRFLKQF
ncbi:MAG TPA: phenylalanine--tRNA ligase subunit alpha [bacterium]|nr:phenylalanine--tRNA ligase subunit alpha [bacterium]